MTLSQTLRREVEGHKIVTVRLNRVGTDYVGDPLYQPIITLDNGTRIIFEVTVADDDGDYGLIPRIFLAQETA